MTLTTTGNRVRKTTPAQRLEMRTRYRTGESLASIAADYGVTPAAVSYHCTDIDRPLQPCGTPAAYRRHQSRGESACDPCKTAWTAYCREH